MFSLWLLFWNILTSQILTDGALSVPSPLQLLSLCREKGSDCISPTAETASCRRRHAFQFVRTVSSGVAFSVQPLQPPTWWTGSQIPRFKLLTGPGLCVCFSCCCDRWSKELQLWRAFPSCCRWEISSRAQGEKYIFYRAWRGDMRSRGWSGGNENELCGTAVLSWQEEMTEHLLKARLSPADYLRIMESVQSTAPCVQSTQICTYMLLWIYVERTPPFFYEIYTNAESALLVFLHSCPMYGVYFFVFVSIKEKVHKS